LSCRAYAANKYTCQRYWIHYYLHTLHTLLTATIARQALKMPFSKAAIQESRRPLDTWRAPFRRAITKEHAIRAMLAFSWWESSSEELFRFRRFSHTPYTVSPLLVIVTFITFNCLARCWFSQLFLHVASMPYCLRWYRRAIAAARVWLYAPSRHIRWRRRHFSPAPPAAARLLSPPIVIDIIAVTR
jgi:hypothetical protein